MSSINKLHQFCLNDRMSLIALLTVLTVLVHTTQAQAYLLSLRQNQAYYRYQNQYPESKNTDTPAAEIERAQASFQSYNQTNSIALQDYESTVAQDNDNSTIIFIKNTNTSELSQTAMDVITIVWYVATFLALAAFFLLMACSDRRCADANSNIPNNVNEAPIPPPTPTPSYSEFAPPSYETVMKMQHAAKTTIFVIPFSKESNNSNTNSNNNNNNAASQPPTTPTTPMVNFYTINELQKLGS